MGWEGERVRGWCGGENMIVLEIGIASEDGLLSTGELQALLEAVESAVPGGGAEGIVVSGRLPVWAYGALTHLFHPRPWVATFEPRLQKGVVVASHTPGVKVGHLVDVSPGDTDRVTVLFPDEGGTG